MKISDNLKVAGISMLLTVGLAACDKPGPAESAGKKIDQTVDSASQKIGDTVEKVGDKLDDQSEKAGVAMDDTAITTKVKAAIFAMPGLKTLQINVYTVKGVVKLSGSVDTAASRDRTIALAKAVDGVRSVENRLEVK